MVVVLLASAAKAHVIEAANVASLKNPAVGGI
jgi:hypothetical protein